MQNHNKAIYKYIPASVCKIFNMVHKYCRLFYFSKAWLSEIYFFRQYTFTFDTTVLHNHKIYISFYKNVFITVFVSFYLIQLKTYYTNINIKIIEYMMNWQVQFWNQCASVRSYHFIMYFIHVYKLQSYTSQRNIKI